MVVGVGEVAVEATGPNARARKLPVYWPVGTHSTPSALAYISAGPRGIPVPGSGSPFTIARKPSAPSATRSGDLDSNGEPPIASVDAPVNTSRGEVTASTLAVGSPGGAANSVRPSPMASAVLPSPTARHGTNATG